VPVERVEQDGVQVPVDGGLRDARDFLEDVVDVLLRQGVVGGLVVGRTLLFDSMNPFWPSFTN
jgi:hypothetical protein